MIATVETLLAQAATVQRKPIWRQSWPRQWQSYENTYRDTLGLDGDSPMQATVETRTLWHQRKIVDNMEIK